MNVRNLQAPMTGVQRYTSEILKRLGVPAQQLAPSRRLSAIRGHLWEQAMLPRLTRGRLLWSPANTGPVAVGAQVATIHDAAALDHPEWFDRRFGAWYRWMLPRLARRSAHVITVSEFARARLAERCRIAPERITAIPLGVDPSFASSTAADVAAARAALALPDGPYFLTLGTREPRKNLSMLLEAWRLAQARVPEEISLVLAGGSGLGHVFRHGQDHLGLPARVHSTQRVPAEHLPGLLAGALAFLSASSYEGFGLPPLEAATAGTPVIASDIPAHREVLRDGAIFIDPRDVESAADAMIRIAGDEGLRAHMTASGARVASAYSWESTARATERLLTAHLS